MTTSPNSQILQELEERTLDSLWSQWTQLGIAGTGGRDKAPYVIDPEALLLATIRFGKKDSRLVGEVLDWLALNGNLISLQRLKNLQAATQLSSPQALAELGSYLAAQGYRNWRNLFGSMLPGSHCFVPQSFQRRGLSAEPDCALPANFTLRLRAIFGVNARPEVLLWMLTHHSGYPAEIAPAIGWFSKSIQPILNELELAGVLHSEPAGRKKLFSLNPRNQTFHPALPEGLSWRSQQWIYLAKLHIQESLLAINQPNSIEIKAITIRERLPHLRQSLRQANIGELFTGLDKLRGAALLDHFLDESQRFMQIESESVKATKGAAAHAPQRSYSPG